jgi:Tfp pilus assembly protein FimT
MSKSFTLIELLVATAIIVLLTALILPNYRAGDKSLALQRSANKLAQDIRRVQDMAMSAKEIEGAPASWRYGYGIRLAKSQPNQYILFADLDNGEDYDPGEEIETITLERMVKIDELLPSSPLIVIFEPPDPTVTITPDDNMASIKLGVSVSLQKTIKINKAGLIAVD